MQIAIMLQFAIFPSAYVRAPGIIISLPESGFRLKKQPATFMVSRHVPPRQNTPVGRRVESHRIRNQRSKTGLTNLPLKGG